jgi:predicted DsbA family dithiol-disulfide isomerase
MKVEIWSDIVCPWCYIGKRRFETALAQFPHRDQVKVTWRSFELDPQAPARITGSLTELLARKYGMPVAQAATNQAQITGLAAKERLEYHLDRAQSGNTFLAHQLLHLAGAHGLQDPMKERLMRAYFTEGLPVGDLETLVGLAREVGLDAEEARAALETGLHADAVRQDERLAAALGIRGVPFVVLDEQYGVSGAQAATVFLQALETAWAAGHPLVAVGGADGAPACEGDACAI